jgi:hypothetical protein
MKSTTLSLRRPTVAQAPAVKTQRIPPVVDKREFWFVWSPVELAPKRRHPSLESAQGEAQRLRTIAPDREFLVYHAEQVI